MKTKRGNSYNRSAYFDYFINGKYVWVQGELHYNERKSRYEHIHIGKRGGETLIYWTIQELTN